MRGTQTKNHLTHVEKHTPQGGPCKIPGAAGGEGEPGASLAGPARGGGGAPENALPREAHPHRGIRIQVARLGLPVPVGSGRLRGAAGAAQQRPRRAERGGWEGRGYAGVRS